LLATVDAGTAATLRPQIDAARIDAGLPPLPSASVAADASSHALTVRVALDPAFAARSRLRDDASVFVIARVPGGPPMPVAVERHSVRDLPLTITLDDSDGPMPTRRLSAVAEVDVLARLSTSGDAMRREGDVESKPVRVKLPAGGQVELLVGGP
jgi:cytochrome c-type biogenesis protein CcmH